MKKRNLLFSLLLTLLLVLTAGLFSACGEAKIVSIQVDGEEQVCLDEFDLDDYSIVATYDDSSRKYFALTENNLSQEDLAKLQTVGEHTLTVTYKQVTGEWNITIVNHDFTGLAFDDITVDYDGQPHTLAVTGLPQGASVQYDKDNTYTNAGKYEITATVSMPNYNTETLTATLKINTIDFAGLSFDDLTFDYDGQPHTLAVTGLPQGARVEYDKETTYTNIGEYTVTATVSMANYNTKTLTATLKINKLNFTGLAFDDITVDYDGQPHRLSPLAGAPQGAIIEYDKAIVSYTKVGKYTVTATVSMPNYNTKKLTATLTIYTPLDITVSGGAATVEGFKDGETRTCVVVPVTYNDVPVMMIGDFAFFGYTSLTSIQIPVGVTTIGSGAFYNCTSLTSIEIPASITTIGSTAFLGCSSLTSIMVETNNTAYQSIDGNLYSKDEKTLVQYAAGKKATSFAVPANVTTIGYSAFADCTSLTSIEIPASVTTIEWFAFEGCSSLTSVTFAENSSLTTIGDDAFYNCTSLTSIEIPASVTTIGDDAFADCTSLTRIVLPASLTTIGTRAFADCTSLTSITFEGTVAEWNALSKGSYWNSKVPATEVVCSDGTVSL